MIKLTRLFNDFFESERAGGILLIICTVISLILANSFLQSIYLQFWNLQVADHTIAHWINDGLMTIFFLLIGLELERELYVGEFSEFKNALLPIFAAFGGAVIPAVIHFSLNYGSATQPGFGIPMATDIAFALAVLSLVGKHIPASLKIFLTALAVIDDLIAIIVIALFYTASVSLINLIIALLLFFVLIILNRLRVYSLIPYLIGGAAMWYFMLHSGVHATIVGVLLAFAIPFNKESEKSPSAIVEHFLQKPVSFIILPLFALANTGIILNGKLFQDIVQPNYLGIMIGLVLGKPIGITMLGLLAVALRLSALPRDINWYHFIAVGFMGGIGFTMSIFITMLAFDQSETINLSKIAIMLASLVAASIGFLLLKLTLHRNSNENNFIS